MRNTVVAALLLLAMCAFSRETEGQKALRDDDRAYSNAMEDRRYVAARCAALYSEIAQTIIGDEGGVAAAKLSEAHEFLKRVPEPAEDVLFKWSSAYKKRLAEPNNPGTALWHADYEACRAILLLIRGGDNITKYTRQELRYLMGGDAKGPLK